MKKVVIVLLGLFLFVCAVAIAAVQDLEIKGRKLLSRKPAFTLMLPSEVQFVHFSTVEVPKENSRTRNYLFIRERNKQVEELLIVQIADKTNPQAGPMTIPPLKPYAEKRMYVKEKIKRGELAVDYLIQLMAWNPDAPSLQPIVKRGIAIPSRWALQGQLLFSYQAEHAVFVRYSRDVSSFGLESSEKGKEWERESISGNEKRIYETFRKIFTGIIDSIEIKNP